MKKKPVTFISLKPKQIYKEQLKLKKGKMAENKNLYIRGPSLLTRFFLVLMMILFFNLVLIC
jgi:hypothetical protein